jgi:2-dehydro-3-deoxyphosphooctonate aldolase (KDO 8-P synthase)
MNTQSRKVYIGDSIVVSKENPLLVISGPCQIESEKHALEMAHAITEACRDLPVQLVYKSSYDKANRTSIAAQRGAGIDAGLSILAKVRETYAVPVLSDIHDLRQISPAAEVLDVLQIPAFLCRQTDLLLAAGETGKAIHVKKGQFLHPSDMAHVAGKIASTGNMNILLCERGSCFGYRDLVVDMRGLLIMRETGYPVVFDGTHSVQSMGGQNGSSGGQREYVAPLTRAAVAVGVDGVFLECHQDPDRAPSDGPSMLAVQDLRPLLKALCALRASSEAS